MAWDHFNPGKPRPWKINYVQDRDLWTWALPNSNAVNAYIRTRVRTVEDFDELFPLDMPTREIDLGSMVLDAEASYVRETMKNARKGVLQQSWGDLIVPIVNASTYCHSELLGELAKGADFAVGWFATARGTYRYSLRSDPQGLDVSAIAKLFGGGGHKHAAGFEVDQPVHTYV
jgi:oligoribonuclease NrnB/cAMP/cGMP phosphodiesterase (DHH superfamily)